MQESLHTGLCVPEQGVALPFCFLLICTFAYEVAIFGLFVYHIFGPSARIPLCVLISDIKYISAYHFVLQKKAKKVPASWAT